MSRKREPCVDYYQDFDHFGTVAVTVPLGVRTLILASLTASSHQIGRSRWMLSSFRVRQHADLDQAIAG
jgi:hypothetical protein